MNTTTASDAQPPMIDTLGRVSESLSKSVREQYSNPFWCVAPGQHWLELGSGTGEMALALAQWVGQHGSVTGIDISAAQIRNAVQRLAERDQYVQSRIEFLIADAHQLPFANESFDGCRADRVFQHLEHREQAIDEMVRVSKPGAWICLSEPDWDTLVIDAPNREFSRLLTASISDSIRNGWTGRQLARLVKQAGLIDVLVVPGSLIVTNLNMADELYGLRAAAARLQLSEAVSESAVAEWFKSLQANQECNRFFCSLTGFSVYARKPLRMQAARSQCY